MSRRNKRTTTTPESDQHFIRMMEWLAMESRAEVSRMAERRRRLKSRNAEKNGDSLLDLVVVDYRTGLGGRSFVQFSKRRENIALPWNRLRVGAPVVASEYPEDKSDGRTGVVSKVRMDFIEVAFDKYPDGRVFRLDLTADEVTRQRQLAAINIVRESRGRLGELRRIMAGEKEPTFGPESKCRFFFDLNESQQQAVEFALAANELAVIHGPPGTGKTTTVVEFIVQAIRRGAKVLACAPSNAAVDNLLQKLVDANQNVVRLGHPARVDETLHRCTLDGMVEDSESMPVIRSMLREAEELFRKVDRFTRARPERGAKAEMRREAGMLKSQARALEKQTIHNILDRANVVCTTNTFNESLLGDRWFDIVVIDEACQSTEPGSWFPIKRGDKVVLAGDHKQLPPTIISTEAANQGFATSLMERQVDTWGEQVSRLLTVQYRMHKDIQEFSSQQFYGGRLQAHESVQSHLLTDLDGIVESELTTTPLLFCDTAGGGWEEELEPEGDSKRNPKEAEWVVAKVAELVKHGLDPGNIAVIAPYAAQVRLLRKSLDFRGLEVNTVDGFQGREKEAVIISTVRSNAINEIGFLGDVRRMNVAITRARRKLCIVGDSSTLSTHPFFKDLLDFFESQGAYTTIWN